MMGREAKLVDGLLDVLPYDRWTEQELQLWLVVFEGALRYHYDLQAEKVGVGHS